MIWRKALRLYFALWGVWIVFAIELNHIAPLPQPWRWLGYAAGVVVCFRLLFRRWPWQRRPPREPAGPYRTQAELEAVRKEREYWQGRVAELEARLAALEAQQQQQRE